MSCSSRSFRRKLRNLKIIVLVFFMCLFLNTSLFSLDILQTTTKETEKTVTEKNEKTVTKETEKIIPKQTEKTITEEAKEIVSEKTEERTKLLQEQKLKHQLEPALSSYGGLMKLKPGISVGELAPNSTCIIGITTVERKEKDYLFDTIKSLETNGGASKKKFSYLVYIGDADQMYNKERSRQIKERFENLMISKRLMVIGPSLNYYPSNWFDVIKPSFGDSITHVKWRSKQNLDQIFLMMYAYQYSPTYYMMMEDDVIATKNYTDYIIKVLLRA